jgi:ATP/maltotriose-dependent transcriptional regulator MalT
VRWFFGDSEQAVELLDEAIAAMEGHTDPATHAELATTVAYRGLVSGIREGEHEARPFIERALAMVEGTSDRRLEALVLSDIGTVDSIHSNNPTRLLRSIQLADEVGLHVDVVRGQASLASGALTHRDYESAFRYLDEADTYAEAHQVYAFSGLIGAIRAQALFETGDWPAAEEAASSVVAHESFARIPAAIVTARLKVRRGDADATEAITAALADAKATGEAQRVVPAMGAAAEHAWMQDRLGEVVEDLEWAHGLALRTGSARWIGETSIWLSGLGRLDRVPEGAEEVAKHMVRADWDAATAEWDRIGSPYEAAACRVLADEPETVIAGLVELDRLGAAPMARWTRNRLARMGVDKIPRGPRRSTASNPAGLTARQMDVLGLVVEGFTNAEIAERLFLSARTVDHHVAAILLKLEVESRRQVRQRAEQLGLLDA